MLRAFIPAALTTIVCGLLVLVTGEAIAQGRLTVPPQIIEVDLSDSNRRRERTFSRRGMGFSTPLEFFFLKHDQVTIVVNPPAVEGAIEVTCSNANAWVRIEPQPAAAGGKFRADVIRTTRIISPKALAASAAAESLKLAMDAYGKQVTAAAKNFKQPRLRTELRTRAIGFEDETPVPALRKLYIEARVKELATSIYQKKLAEIAAAKKTWFTPDQLTGLSRLEGAAAARRHVELLFYTHAETYLKDEVGLRFESGNTAYAEIIARKLEAVYMFTSGGTVGDKDAAGFVSKTLGQEDRAKISEGLKLELRCSFFPAAPEEDPNSQWFAAQQVSCRASRVASIGVQGELDPAENDSVDWFELIDYDAAVKITAPENPAVQVELPPYRHNGRVFLRVRATGKQKAAYGFRIIPARPSQPHKVMIYETPVRSTARFPF